MVGERILYVLIMLMSENKGGNDDDDDYKHHNCSCNHQFYAAFVSRSFPLGSFVHCLITIIHVLLFMFFLYYCRFVYVYMNLYSFFLCLLFCLYGFYNRHFRHRSSFCCDVERERYISDSKIIVLESECCIVLKEK